MSTDNLKQIPEPILSKIKEWACLLKGQELHTYMEGAQRGYNVTHEYDQTLITDYMQRSENIIQGQLATINELTKENSRLKSIVVADVTKTSVAFNNAIELYALRNKLTPVDVFEKLYSGDQELKATIEKIVNGEKI